MEGPLDVKARSCIVLYSAESCEVAETRLALAEAIGRDRLRAGGGEHVAWCWGWRTPQGVDIV